MINFKITQKIIFLFSLILIISCSGGDDPTPTPPDPSPDAAVLITPLKDEECNQGNIISDESSNVEFEWNKALNTTSYTLVIKNLNTSKTSEINTSNTKATSALLRGVPYSWYVISKTSSSNKTATSATWNFYNAGTPVENHAPFPAYDPNPPMGAQTTSFTSIEWKSGDIDNDIASYDVYLGTDNPPTELYKNTTATKIEDIQLAGNTIYYWFVITKDSHGNNSKSQVFEFRTQ